MKPSLSPLLSPALIEAACVGLCWVSGMVSNVKCQMSNAQFHRKKLYLKYFTKYITDPLMKEPDMNIEALIDEERLSNKWVGKLFDHIKYFGFSIFLSKYCTPFSINLTLFSKNFEFNNLGFWCFSSGKNFSCLK